jgi:diguanylate cyclase
MDSEVTQRAKRARLNPAEFLAELKAALARSKRDRVGVLTLQLNRSDRIAALAQDPIANLVLKQAAERIEPLLKTDDYYCVVAHDEIWIMLDCLASDSVASLAASGLREALRPVITVQRNATGVRTIRMNPSIGIVVVPSGQTDVSEVLHQLDEALSHAKHSDDMTFLTRLSEESTLGKRAQLEIELRQALYANELEVHFQPQIDLRTNKCVSAEALIRWTRQNGKPVNAALIASICEETGLIEQLTRFVINNTLRLLMTLKAQGIDLKISINLSAASLSDETFPEQVLQAAQTWGVSPSRLVFEVTEGSIVQNEKAAVGFMQSLRELGCELSIDDFGTGYSSLAYLKQFPFSELKIDRSFVEDLGKDEASSKLVRVLTDLCQLFNLRCVAEGVEDEIVQGILAKLGCDIGQGYFYARAMPHADFGTWVNRYNQRAGADQFASLSPA